MGLTYTRTYEHANDYTQNTQLTPKYSKTLADSRADAFPSKSIETRTRPQRGVETVSASQLVKRIAHWTSDWVHPWLH